MRVNQEMGEMRAQLGGVSSSSADRSAGSKSKLDRNDSSNSDSIFLSDLSNLVSRVTEAGGSERAGYVSKLGAAYRQGTYNINLGALGDALLERGFEG